MALISQSHPSTTTLPSINGRRLVTMLLLSALVLSSSGRQVEASAGFRLCGLKLTMMLNAICKQQLCGGFVFGSTAKRKSPDLPPFLEHGYGEGEEEEDGYQMENEQSALREGRPKRSYPYGSFGPSKKSGIATECCSKRCTLSYMKTYCCASGPAANHGSENANEEE